MPPHRGRVFKQRPHQFGRFYGRAVSIFPAWRVLCRRTGAGFLSNAPSTTCCACFGRFNGRDMSGGDRYWSEILSGEPPLGVGEVDWRPAVMLFSSVAGSLPPRRGGVFKQRPQCFGRSVGRAVTHFSSVAGSMPPHRGAVFKQRPHRFGRGFGWGGGDGQEGDSGGEDLQIGLGQPPPGGWDGKGPVFVRSSKRPAHPPIHPANSPHPRRNQRYRQPQCPRLKPATGEVCPYTIAGFLNRL
jgi:hypothetical protein